jgi:formate/nitrite transporter FocA (FNT family)
MAGSTADQAPAEGESEGLGEEERAQAADHAAPHAKVIHEVIRHEGEIELARSVGALVWSGLAAGLSMGFSLICLAFLHVGLPQAPWRHIVESPGYSVGFVITILGRQQLFTESTLTGLLPFLVARDRPTLVALARTWSVVLVANLAGTALIAGAISVPGLFPDDIHRAMIEIGQTAMAGSFWQKAGRAVFAGWLIALMVWLLPSAKSARLFVILLLTTIVALCSFPHIIAGSVETELLVFTGDAGVQDYLFRFLVPVLLGNTLGGVALAALLNYAPLAPEIQSDSQPDADQT